MMERQTPQSVGDVLRNLLEDTSLQTRMEELKAADLWSKIVGESISSQTSKPSVKNGTMQIGVPNAALRNELYINRSRLIEIINQNLGKKIIIEIRFTS